MIKILKTSAPENMDVILVSATLPGIEFLQTNCQNCEQPILVENDIVIVILRDDGEMFLLSKKMQCRQCGRETPLVKSFTDREEAVLEIIRLSSIINRTNDLSSIQMLSLVAPPDLLEIPI